MAAFLHKIRQLLSHQEPHVAQGTGRSHWMPAPNMLISLCQEWTAPSKLQVIGWCTIFEKSLTASLTIAQWSFTTFPLKEKWKRYNVLSRNQQICHFCYFSKMLILQLFVKNVLKILLIFFPLETLMCTLMPPFIIGLAFFPALPCWLQTYPGYFVVVTGSWSFRHVCGL